MSEEFESRSFMIIGLGNPGRKFREDRHNIGFMVLDRFSKKVGESFSKVKFDALLTKVSYKGEKLYLAKPQVYMNNSGSSVAQLKRYYRIPNTNFLVIYDDLDLPLGYLRLRPQGGSGGHNGMMSIINQLGFQDFPRMRLGIGRPPGKMEPAAYVLQAFSEEDNPLVDIVLNRAVECVETFISEGLECAMNRFNVRNGEK